MWKRLKHYRPKYKWSPRETTWGDPVLMSNWNRGRRTASVVLMTHRLWTQIWWTTHTEDPDWVLACACHPNGVFLGLPRDVTYDVLVRHADQALDMLVNRSKHRISKGTPEPLDKIFVDMCNEVLA